MVIAPGTYSDGTYKRTSPKVIDSCIVSLSNSEQKAVRKGRRGCSCNGTELRDLAQYCVNRAADKNAKSWSIYPIPHTRTVLVEFHNWKEMGMCNFEVPVARKNYWWDKRPVPDWMSPADGEKTHFKEDPFDPDA